MTQRTPVPDRPAGVPADATFSTQWNVWAVGETRGETQVGVWRAYHATLGHRTHDSHFDDDGELVHVTRYHVDGSVAHEVPHRNGVLHGLARSFRAKPPTTDPYFAALPAVVMSHQTPCIDGIPCGLSQLFDGDGNEVSATGVRKPAGVPAAARTVSDGDWVLGEQELGADYRGVKTTWRPSGVLRTVDWYDEQRNLLRRIRFEDDGSEGATTVFRDGEAKAPPLRVIRRPDRSAKPIGADDERKWRIAHDPAAANSVARLFHLDGTPWCEVSYAADEATGLRLFGESGALVLEERWETTAKGRRVTSLTTHTTSPPQTLELNARAVATAWSAGEVSVKLSKATATKHPDAAWFFDCFARYFQAWLGAPGVTLSLKGIDIAALSTTSMRGPLAASTLFVDAAGNSVIVLDDGAAAGTVVLLDHEEGPGSLDAITALLRDRKLRGLDSDALAKELGLLDNALATTVVEALRGIKVTSTNAAKVARH